MNGMFARKRFQQQLCESAALEELEKKEGALYVVWTFEPIGLADENHPVR